MTLDYHSPFRKPFENIEDFIAQPVSITEEKELYSAFYDRIYIFLREGKLDYAAVAEKTGLKERRIREALQYRLTGEVLQLFGLKRGICFVCNESLYQPTTQEPLCLRCLQRVAHAIQETQDSPRSSSLQHLPPAAADGNMVLIPKQEYERLRKDLEQYKAHFGPLDVVQAPSGPCPETPPVILSNVEQDLAKVDEVFHKEDVLSILEMDESDAKNDNLTGEEEINSLLQSFQASNTPLRHYGFKRVKR